MQKITPFLWFDNRAEEAAKFYTSIFKNSKISAISRYNGEGPGTAGKVMTVNFEIEGQEFTALNGGPEFSFTPAVSFFVSCEDQAEVDWFWERLSEGGEEVQCGWLTDKFGISWQIVPKILMTLMQDEDLRKAQNVTRAMLQMKKIDIQQLIQAYEQA